jgi:hypothetical protein
LETHCDWEGRIAYELDRLGSAASVALARPERQYRLHGDARFFTLGLFTLFDGRRAASAHCHEFLPCFYSPFERCAIALAV